MGSPYPGPRGRRLAVQLGATDANALLQNTLPYLLRTLTPEQIGRVQKVLDAAVVNPVLQQQYAGASRKYAQWERAHGIYHSQSSRPTESPQMRRIDDELIAVDGSDKHILVQHQKLLAHDALIPQSDNPDEAAYLSKIMQSLGSQGVYLRVEPMLVRDPSDPSARVISQRDFNVWLSYGYDGDVIPTKDGRLTRDNLLDTKVFGAGYYTHVMNGPFSTSMHEAAERVSQVVMGGQQVHLRQAGVRDTAAPGVVGISDWLGDADYPPVSMWDQPWKLYMRGRDLMNGGHYVEAGKVLTYAAIFGQIATKRLNDYIDATVKGAARAVGALSVIVKVSETLETVLFAWSMAGFALRFAAGEAVATAADRAVFDKMLQATSSAGDKLELDVLDRAVGWSEDVTKVFDATARTGRELSEAQLDELCKAADAKWGNPGRAAKYVSTGLPNKPISDFGREVSDGVKRYFVH